MRTCHLLLAVAVAVLSSGCSSVPSCCGKSARAYSRPAELISPVEATPVAVTKVETIHRGPVVIEQWVQRWKVMLTQ